MVKYIALLRGVNVGGNNKVPMAQLKTCFENIGFQNVSTYINSGNVLFESSDSDAAVLVEISEHAIKKTFNVTTRVAIISVHDFHDAMTHAPSWWNKDPESKHNTLFVIPPANAKKVMKEAGEIKPQYEKLANYKNVIFWSAPLTTFSQTRWAKIVGKSAYNDVTIRNANTANKLRDLTKSSTE